MTLQRFMKIASKLLALAYSQTEKQRRLQLHYLLRQGNHGTARTLMSKY